jgi:hypothetical protein
MNHAGNTTLAASIGLYAKVVSVVSATAAPRGF